MMLFLEALAFNNRKMKSLNTRKGGQLALSLFQVICIISLCLFAVTANKNRINVCIVTDEAFVKHCFNGNREAAANYSIKNIDDINQHLLDEEFVYTDSNGETYYYTNFGFYPEIINLEHKAFAPFNQQQSLDVDQLKATLTSSHFEYERKECGLVAFFTGKQMTDRYQGFKCGSVCSPPYNTLAVSFHECPLKVGSEAHRQVLVTLFHELLHIIGVPHNNTNNDVMMEYGANNMNLSLETRKHIAQSFYKAQVKSCLSIEGENVGLVFGNEKKKPVKYHEVVEHMNAIAKEELEKGDGAETTDKPNDIFSAGLNFLRNYWIFIGCVAALFTGGGFTLFYKQVFSSRGRGPLSSWAVDGWGTQGPKKPTTKPKKPKVKKTKGD